MKKIVPKIDKKHNLVPMSENQAAEKALSFRINTTTKPSNPK